MNRKAQLAALLALGSAVGYLFVLPIIKGLFTQEKELEEFSVSIFDLTTTDEEDLEIIIALREFFDNNAPVIGNDGYTSWLIDD